MLATLGRTAPRRSALRRSVALAGAVVLTAGSLTAAAPQAAATLSGGPSVGILTVSYTAGRQIEERDSTVVTAPYPPDGAVSINPGDPLGFTLEHYVHGMESTGSGSCGGVYSTTRQGSQPWLSFYVNPVTPDQAGVSPAHSGYLLQAPGGVRSYTDTYLCHDGGLLDPTVTDEYTHKETTQGTLDTTKLPAGCYELDTYLAEDLDIYAGRMGDVARFSVGGGTCGGPVATEDHVTVEENQLGPVPTPYAIDWTVGDYDPDGEAVSLVSATRPLHGTTVVSGNALLYTPIAGFSGADQFLYTITDPHGAQASATVYVVVTPVCDRAFTTGTAEAQRTGLVPTNISSEYLSFSMSVPWCHDGRHAILPGGEASVGLNTGQVGFENDPLFLLLNGSIGLQIVEDPAATRAVATSQPDGSLVVTGRTVFKATVDVVQIALALLPEFGVEARLQKAFSAMPPRARVALVHQLAGRLLDRLYPRITGVIWVDELPAFAKALEDGIDQILSSAAGMTLNIPVGVETWGPEFQFTLYPGGSATYSFGGPHGTLFDPVVTDFQNNP